MTPKKRSHKNNKARTIAPERAKEMLEELTVATTTIKGVRRRIMLADDGLCVAVISRILADHAAATLDRKKRRAR